jgi:hypothetical protein
LYLSLPVLPVADGERSDHEPIHLNTPGVTLSKTITAFEAAKTAHAEAVEAFQAANAAYLKSIAAANVEITELIRLDEAIKAGDSSVAGERIIVKAKADDLTEVSKAHDRAVLVALNRRDSTYANLLAERLRASVGAMKSTPTLRALETEARQEIDKILFALADKVDAHNRELATSTDAIIEAQARWNPKARVEAFKVNLAVEARNDSSGRLLSVDGVEYRETTINHVIGNTVGYPAIRWADDRKADELAARRAENGLRSIEAARLANERSDAVGAKYRVEAEAAKR